MCPLRLLTSSFPRYWMLPRPSRTLLECPRLTARSHFQAHQHSHEYLLKLVSTLTCNPPSRAPVVPKPVTLALVRVAQCIWWPALSPDEVERRYIDDADAPGDWALVDVEPDEIENHAITYVHCYHSAYVSTSLVLCPPSRWEVPVGHIGPSCDPLSLDIYTSFI
jgi:hypothetical protein